MSGLVAALPFASDKPYQAHVMPTPKIQKKTYKSIV
jgi:hypothetical protein